MQFAVRSILPHKLRTDLSIRVYKVLSDNNFALNIYRKVSLPALLSVKIQYMSIFLVLKNCLIKISSQLASFLPLFLCYHGGGIFFTHFQLLKAGYDSSLTHSLILFFSS